MHPREGRKKIEKGKKLPILHRFMCTATTSDGSDVQEVIPLKIPLLIIFCFLKIKTTGVEGNLNIYIAEWTDLFLNDTRPI